MSNSADGNFLSQTAPDSDGITVLVNRPVNPGQAFDPSHFSRLFELESQSFWFRGRSDLIGWALRRYFPEARSFMEIGCGTGYVLDRLQSEFPNVAFSGSELFAEGLRYARQRLPDSVHLYQLDATDMPFRESFDAMGAFDVIEHIEDDRCVLENIFRSLKPGGGLLLTVPQHAWLWSQTDVAACHVRRYQKTVLLKLLGETGFTVERASSFVSLLLPAMLLARMRGQNGTEEVESELNLPQLLNEFGYFSLRAEAALIRAGFTLPLGGSLIVIARKPDDA